MIAICLPSRGLVYSKTMQSVIEGMQALNQIGIATKYFCSHDLPIPDSHNYCVETALQDPAVDKIFIIEEDMYIFPDAFVALATSEFDIASLQYNDKNGSPFGIVHKNEAGEVIWTGVGAVTIKREVFEKLGVPYFKTHPRYGVKKKQNENGVYVSEFYELEGSDPYAYGGLDINFYTRARVLGYKINILPEYKAHHFALVKLGPEADNNGCHLIRQV